MTHTIALTSHFLRSILYLGDDLLIVDQYAQSVRVVRGGTGNIELVVTAATPLAAVNFSAHSLAVNTRLSAPRGVVRGNGADATALFVVDSNALVIIRLSADGYVSLVAGSGKICADTTAKCGDDGPASAALLNFPTGIAIRANGDIVWSDTGSHRVRTVLRGPNIVTTIAGTGEQSYYSLPGTLATATATNRPLGIAVDPATDEVLFGDENSILWRICGTHCATGMPGTLAIVAGIPGSGGVFTPGLYNTPLNGDISIGVPAFMAVSSKGILYFPDQYWSIIYAVNLTSSGVGNAGSITQFAGTEWSGKRPFYTTGPVARYADIGDGRPALNATFNLCFGVAVDDVTGSVFISDFYDQLVSGEQGASLV